MPELETEFGFMTELERYEAFLKLYRSSDPADADRLFLLYTGPDPLIPLIMLQYLEELPEKNAAQAIVSLLESDNEIVARAAMASYQRSHYPGKARLLKELILSPIPRACRFAVRTLSRAGFMEILPLILRELPDRDGEVQREMLEGLRFLPDRRSLPVLVPLARSGEARSRLAALSALSELHARTGAVPLSLFLELARDESQPVRLAALEALERFPTRRVAPLILKAALDAAQPEEARARAIRALGRFPSAALARPLAALASSDASPAVKLAAEATLRAFPAAAVKRGLAPMLDEKEPAARRQAAMALAELLGHQPDVRAKLLALWRGLPPLDAVDLVDVLRVLGGADSAVLLAESARGASALAYAACEALARLHGRGTGSVVLGLLKDPNVAGAGRQALLSRWARREPEEEVRAELRAHLLELLRDPMLNIRYGALHALSWYPLGGTLIALLDLLSVEEDPETARTAGRLISRGLGRDPLPLVEAVRGRADGGRLLGHVVRILNGRAWDPASAPLLLDALSEPPLRLLDMRPETWLAVACHLVEQGAVRLQEVWKRAGDPARRLLLLELMASFSASPRRRFPRLPLAFLERSLHGAGASSRGCYMRLLAIDGRNDALEALAAAVAREKDAELRAAGAALLRSKLLEEPR